MERRQTFALLLDALAEEERVLSRLVALASEEQQALVTSDYGAVEQLSARLGEAADELGGLEERREALMIGLSADGATLDELLPLARDVGIDGLDAARVRLAERVSHLQDVQEQNARLILGALRLRERWFNLLGGLGNAPTYSALGRQDATARRGFVSRSA